MPFVEQAIFTSAETDRSAGYQVVAKSPGVCEEDARELAVWGPSHDSLLEIEPQPQSINFHPLPSGAFCVSQTNAAGWEYSGRGGHRIYTQCLIVPPEVLRRFGNNPFTLLRAALAGGMIEVYEHVPARLEPLLLAGGAAPVDKNLLARLATNPGPQAMAMLVQAASDSVCLALGGEPSAADLIAGLLSCLPPECRTEFSFSTGLKFSSRRPFRIVALSNDPAEQRWVAHHNNVSVLDLHRQEAFQAMPFDSWAQLIERVLAAGRTTFLATQLSKRRIQLEPEDLSALGLQLLEELDGGSFLENSRPAAEPNAPLQHDDPPSISAAPEGLTRAHAAHTRFTGDSPCATIERSTQRPPSEMLNTTSPEVLARLEQLDDVVYEAIDGQPQALEQLKTLWPKVLSELPEYLVGESREQYLRYALAICEDFAQQKGARDPSRAIRALDALCVLFCDID